MLYEVMDRIGWTNSHAGMESCNHVPQLEYNLMNATEHQPVLVLAGDYSPRAHRNPSLEKPCTTVSVGTYHQGSEADFLRLLFWPHKLFQIVRIKQRWWLINHPHSDQVDALLGRCHNYL